MCFSPVYPPVTPVPSPDPDSRPIPFLSFPFLPFPLPNSSLQIAPPRYHRRLNSPPPPLPPPLHPRFWHACRRRRHSRSSTPFRNLWPFDFEVGLVSSKQTFQMEFQASRAHMEPMHKETMEAACHEGTTTDGSSTDECDPWDPPYPPFVPSDEDDFATTLTLAVKWLDDKDAVLGAHRASSIIFPDRTPKLTNLVFHDSLHRLVPILAKDSVRRFLSFMDRNGRGMRWGSIITPEALNQMITQNAVGCVKVALEGQAPELGRCRAGPNCMTQYGYYPLHRAAEMFSVKMIELLVRHGASANLRTAGAEVIEGLLPLHVAVENTCMHKYLENSLFPNHEHRDYSEADTNFIFKLIHLLCLPEMKIFLDTTRLIAKYTDNLLDELLNYIKEGRLAETAVLLLASQEQISKQDGFDIICNLILDINITLESEKSQQTEARIKLNHTILTLVRVISKAGESLDSYIQKHIEVPYFMQVPRVEVLERVSSILKDNGLSPPRECLEIGDLLEKRENRDDGSCNLPGEVSSHGGDQYYLPGLLSR
uniref:Uncharacterized protein n=3 Tax=Avena sativa TaxID=4498 RepID=A0ACD5Y1J4_AVESA